MVERKTAQSSPKGLRRGTVGQISSELALKTPDTRDPIELEREMHSDYEKNVYECVKAHKTVWPKDFYVIVITKKEPLMQNVMRNYFYGRLSCPTPDYDQAVYFYDQRNDIIEFLWVIPSRDTCIHLKENAFLVDPAESQLLRFVLDFADGTLFGIAKARNGEHVGSLLLS